MNDDGTMPTIFEHDGIKEIISLQQLHEWTIDGNEDICVKCSHINCVCEYKFDSYINHVIEQTDCGRLNL